MSLYTVAFNLGLTVCVIIVFVMCDFDIKIEQEQLCFILNEPMGYTIKCGPTY